MHEPRIFRDPSPSDHSLFRVRGLSYRYPDNIQALSGIDLDICSGDKIALVGQNGSGKTTLIKQLCGLLSPTAGEVLYKGTPLTGEYLDRSRLEIGLLFQDPDDQLFGHTVLEDAAFGPRQQGLSRESAELAARQALKQVSLTEMAYKAPHNLSFGQKKRAGLAGLLAMHPEVLFLDEPTANLDPGQEQVFLDLLKDYQGALICVSHDLIFLYELCEMAVVLDQGRLHHDYTMRELVSQRQALRMHGLDFSFRLIITPSDDEKNDRKGSYMLTQDSIRSFPDVSGEKALVALRKYSYRYQDGTLALNNINTNIYSGERISIVGENGAGKTTLLFCILGLRQGKGEFLFDSMPVTRRLQKGLWRQVGMVFQDCADQLVCPSVREEIAFGLHQIGCSRAECRRRIMDALSLVRLEGFEDRVPLHLSGGERKRLALACVLAMEPRLLILDEPTAGLDPQGEELLLAILRDLDVTLLLVSHDMFFVRELTHRTLVMHQGRILEDMPTDVFQQDKRLGNLNGLYFSYRRDTSSAILMLQHEHEYIHSHQHLHALQHGDVEDGQIHEHTHMHRFAHSHPGDEKDHSHAPRRYHDLDHLKHDE
ncbi:conserved hypothetical protein [uncultured Desulfobacterium sp.]|uniref:ABC transporter domain-containing protein n=1 Tax=uncultured Desulfobacterium sp. TaxID=201089 RepID=A0A445MTX4_9BACT|nr:conserved hypothetical protein [uncultured Desulfobacterium sp.]